MVLLLPCCCQIGGGGGSSISDRDIFVAVGTMAMMRMVVMIEDDD